MGAVELAFDRIGGRQSDGKQSGRQKQNEYSKEGWNFTPSVAANRLNESTE